MAAFDAALSSVRKSLESDIVEHDAKTEPLPLRPYVAEQLPEGGKFAPITVIMSERITISGNTGPKRSGGGTSENVAKLNSEAA